MDTPFWKIPIFNTSFDEREKAAVEAVLDSGWLTMGETCQEFERQFAEYIGTKHAIALSSGTAALHLANLAINLKNDDEVICPSFSFVATANSIIYTGAKPVFADISSSSDLNISPSDIERKITKKTKAIIVVHYGGYPCDMESICSIAQKSNLYVIEDCAHALGSRYREKSCGAVSDAGCFSFFSNKNMTTGEGGMVTTNNDQIADRIRLLRSHGMSSVTWDRHQGHAFTYDVSDLGFNYRMDEMRASLGIVQLKKLSSNNTERKRVFSHYRDRFNLIKEIKIPFSNSTDTVSHHLFPILLNDSHKRTELMAYLKTVGIQSSIHYPPIHLFNYFLRQFPHYKGFLPLTEKISDRLVTLPMYPGMTKDDVTFVCKAVSSFIN